MKRGYVRYMAKFNITFPKHPIPTPSVSTWFMDFYPITRRYNFMKKLKEQGHPWRNALYYTKAPLPNFTDVWYEDITYKNKEEEMENFFNLYKRLKKQGLA